MRVVCPDHLGAAALGGGQDHAKGPDRHVCSFFKDDDVDLECTYDIDYPAVFPQKESVLKVGEHVCERRLQAIGGGQDQPRFEDHLRSAEKDLDFSPPLRVLQAPHAPFLSPVGPSRRGINLRVLAVIRPCIFRANGCSWCSYRQNARHRAGLPSN